MKEGTCRQDTVNRALIFIWRTRPDLKRVALARLFRSNMGALGRLRKVYEWDWLRGAAYAHLEAVCRGFDLEQTRMSVIGHWLQRLKWKLKEEWVRQCSRVTPPRKPTKQEREELGSLEIISPDRMPGGWGSFCVEEGGVSFTQAPGGRDLGGLDG